jgi:hypothetical protein
LVRECGHKDAHTDKLALALQPIRRGLDRDVVGRDRLLGGAEGATAPETLRQKDRDNSKSGKWRHRAPADGITLSGAKDRWGDQAGFLTGFHVALSSGDQIDAIRYSFMRH